MAVTQSMLERAIDDMIEMAAGIFTSLDMMTLEDLEEVLLRKLREGYDTLEVNELMAARQALSHEENEKRPCKFCNLMAEKEIELEE